LSHCRFEAHFGSPVGAIAEARAFHPAHARLAAGVL
jgi:hypothetical protein